MISLRTYLEQHKTEASAPCRIDAGGTWDIKALALPFEGIEPVTVNIALSMRTSALLSPFEDGWVKISSRGFPRGQAFQVDRLPFHSPFGLFFAVVSYFGFHGLHVHIRSQSPVKSALGGSSTALVALTKALSKAAVGLGGKKRTSREVLHLTYHLEDAVNGGNCGLQDQAAAVYGGVNKWKWHYSRPTAPFERTPLLNRKGQAELSARLLVAYSGKSHVSARTNQKWIKDFLSAKTRAGWIEANEIVGHLAGAIQERNWGEAAELLQQETSLRKDLTPQAMIPITEELVGQAEASGCGARFAGAGAGGSVWALGEEKNIQVLRKIWEDSLASVRDAHILHCRVDPLGAR
jgi:D-glycero-alpha-D-manno-heptose-7-phosphate kinase